MAQPESLRDPLPPSESYPLQRSRLDSAFSDAGVEEVDMIYFLRAGIEAWKGSGPAEVIDVSYRAPTRDRPNCLEVRIHAVPSEDRHVIEKAIAPRLAEVARWIRELETAEDVRRGSDHCLRVEWTGNSLIVRED